ncbi:MAG: hypothetical protein IPG89_22025 [Bacteroidetes bacterium]|nr:hypothetical protein [Bacteroidota bacterium]
MRLPFLDNKLVEFVLSLPNDYIYKQGFTKRVIRDALKEYIPNEIYQRTDKIGFVGPKEEWLMDKKFIEPIKNARIFLTERGLIPSNDNWINVSLYNFFLAFDNYANWEQLINTKFSYKDFEKVTHIWFSHEHPDHFFPPNLKKIPEEIRKNIVVLFHESMDKKVVDFCNKLNFKKILELPDFESYNINKQVRIVCSRVENETDSWLYGCCGNKNTELK